MSQFKKKLIALKNNFSLNIIIIKNEKFEEKKKATQNVFNPYISQFGINSKKHIPTVKPLVPTFSIRTPPLKASSIASNIFIVRKTFFL